MGRSTVYNNITTPEKISNINVQNLDLLNDFLDYLKSVGRAATTLKNYKADLLVFFCWCEDELKNKYFVDLTKREMARFQNHAISVWRWSPNRVRTVKAAISSLSNFIENILDDEIQGYKPIVRKIESPPLAPTREKTVYTDEEVECLLNELLEREEYDRACFVALAAYSGRRKSELLRFRVDDFDDDKLVCEGALYKSRPIKTKGRAGGKFIPCYTLAKKFKPFFDKWMRARAEKGIQSEWLFPKKGDWSNPMSISTVDGWTDEFTKITGKPFYCHAMRHFQVSELARAGIPAEVIKELQSWEDVSMVSVYNDTSADDTLSQYFGKDGIKNVVKKDFNDL